MADKEKLKEFQILDQNIFTLSNQKQTFQSQMMEVENALSEIDKTDTAYEIIGNIMVKKDKAVIKKELESKKDMLNIRISSIEKQEERLKQKHSALQKEISEEIR